MKIVMRDGRVFEGTPLDILDQMRSLAFVATDLSTHAYIDWVVANARRCFDLELCVPAGSVTRRSAALILALLRTGLAADGHVVGWSGGDDDWFWEILERTRGPNVLLALSVELRSFARSALQRFDDGLRRKVYTLDRDDLSRASHLGGDAFVHARAHNVCLGRAHFDAVLADPTRFEAKALRGVFAIAPSLARSTLPLSRVPILTGSNPLGWPEDFHG